MKCSPANTAVMAQIKLTTLINITDYFSMALFSSHEQTHACHMIQVHAGLSECFHYPANADVDCGIFNVHMCSFLVCIHAESLSLKSQFRVSSKGHFAKFK